MFTERILIVIAASCTLVFPQTPGSIAGKITSAESGSALAGGHLVATRSRAGAAPIFFEATSASDGSYVIANVLAGDYTVCVQYQPPAHRGSWRDFWQMSAGVEHEIVYLDPCDWTEGTKVTVNTSPVVFDIQLVRGVNVSVWVDDPVEDLQIHVADTAGVIRTVLHPRSDVAGVRRYSAILPKAGRYNLVMRSRGGGRQLPIETGTRSHLLIPLKNF